MATAQQDHLSVFAGTLIMNDWKEAFAQPQDLNFTGDSLVGLAAGRDWSLGWRGLSAGIEGQLAWHFGDGYSYGQIALPAVLRYDPGCSGYCCAALPMALACPTPPRYPSPRSRRAANRNGRCSTGFSRPSSVAPSGRCAIFRPVASPLDRVWR
ncbi:MAG: hypothetical protein JKP98_04155, partial [Rhodobacteraceae bacterium]|nr:hypothetical protein [Paracoccaceae bacterium]